MLTAGLNTLDSIAQLITVLFVFVFVLALTFFVTRWLARYQKGQWSGSNIEILETCPMGNGKYIQIARIGDIYVAMAVCKDTVTFLARLSEEQLKMPPQEEKKSRSFKELLQKAKAVYPEGGEKHPKEE